MRCGRMVEIKQSWSILRHGDQTELDDLRFITRNLRIAGFVCDSNRRVTTVSVSSTFNSCGGFKECAQKYGEEFSLETPSWVEEETGSGSCRMTGFGVCGGETLGSATTVLDGRPTSSQHQVLASIYGFGQIQTRPTCSHYWLDTSCNIIICCKNLPSHGPLLPWRLLSSGLYRRVVW
jgi:hypothetical protein